MYRIQMPYTPNTAATELVHSSAQKVRILMASDISVTKMLLHSPSLGCPQVLKY